MHTAISTLFIALFIFLGAGHPAQAQDTPTSSGTVKAFVSILPLASFVQRVGGPYVEVTVLAGPGQDPHTFDPSPQLMAKLAHARVLFRIGFPFEHGLMKKVEGTFKSLEVVDLQQGVKLRAMSQEDTAGKAEAHHHNHKGEHDGHHHHEGEHNGHAHHEGDPDPHTWLDPQRAKIQAQTMADTLIRLDPAHRTQYEKNVKDFQADLDTIDAQLAKALSSIKGKSFFVFHPAYAYFGERYGLKQIAVEAGGKSPTARQLARLIDLAKANGVRVIFVEPQFSQKSAQALASAIGAQLVPLDPLAPDYIKNLKDMAAALESALGMQRP